MDKKENTLERIAKRPVRMMGTEIAVDVEKRILERAEIVTRCLASDGGIIIPEGIVTRAFEQNPVVQAEHGYISGTFSVIGRSLGLAATGRGLMSKTQFADTELGREVGYLYGVNEEHEVYARGWSFGWNTVDMETWGLDRAKEWLGADWDEELVPSWCREDDRIWVATKCVMNEYSAVPVGADRNALTRAFAGGSGVGLAGEWVAAMDLHEAGRRLSEVEKWTKEKVERLTRDIQALRSEGASAAARGDSEAILAEVKSLTEMLRRKRNGRNKKSD